MAGDARRSVASDSGKLVLEFGAEDGRFSLERIAAAGGPEWLSSSSGDGAVWRLAFRGPGGAVKELGSADAPVVGPKVDGQRAVFVWNLPLGSGNATVTMSVRCEKGSPLSYWSLKAAIPEGWNVVRTDFPLIPNIRPEKGLKLAAPAGWGLEYDMAPGVTYEGTYPSCLATMQFVAFYNGGRGLYVGAHDSRGSHKYFNVRAGEDGAAFTCINWPAVAKKSDGTYQVPFEAVIGVFDGDYYDAARIYREFTFKTPWGRGGPVSKRRIPQWLRDTDLWLMPAAEPLENVDACKAALQYFNVPVALHWYNWHQIPFDTLYPDYFPAKPNFAEGVKALQDLGMRVMPYINGRLCDPQSKAWTGEHADKWATRQENGEPNTEVYGSNVPLNVMCPSTDYWQRKIAGIVDRLTNESGVDGVYIDQIGAAGATRCFDPSHGHVPGGGSMWVDGYRKMLAEARRKLPAEKMLTTEENAECWIDQLDALLLVNTPTSSARPIPLFPAVYSGRAITFGFQYVAHDDLQRSLPFRAKMARAFVWGSQLGWVAVERVMAPEVAKDAEFLRNLARCRRFAHDFLTSGDFLGMIDAYGDNPRVHGEATGSFGGTYRIDLPAVLASAWRSEDGRLGIVLANMSDEDHEVEVRLPLAKAGLPVSGEFTMRAFGPEGQVGSEKGGSAMRKVNAPARGAVVLSVSGP